jgi:hypothetical protein
MAVNLSLFAGVGAQFFDNAGNVLTGGKLNTYQAGTTTPLATYTTSAGNVAHTNPIILDASGRVPSGGEIWLTADTLYKFVLTDSNNVLIATYDNVNGANDGSAIFADFANTTDNAKGDALVGFKQSNSSGFAANAVARTVNTKFQDFVSVQDFGAVGNGVTDDTVAVQNFFDYIQANNVGTAYCDGVFAISAGVSFGRTGNCLTKHVVGDANFVALNAIDTMLSFRAGQLLNWNGGVKVTGTGSVQYAGRTCRIGIRIAGQGIASNRMRFDRLEASRFNQIGIYVETLSTLSDLGNVRVSDCGSGRAASGYSLLANWSSRVDTGTTNSTGQRTTITVDQLPPSQFTGTRNPNCFVVINNETYYVYGVDTLNSKITVYPWIDLNVTSGSLRYLFGGGIYTNGGDAGILGINQIDAVRCSFGLNTTALYGPIVNRFVTQFCAVGFGFGGAPEGACVTFQLNGFYTEGNDFDILRTTRATVGGIIASSYALNFGKITYTSDSRTSANTYGDTFNNMRSVAIYQNGILNQFKQPRKNDASTGSTLSLNVTDSPLNNQYKRDSWTINLVRPNLPNNDTFGYNSDTITLVGTGVNFAPTGTFTFVAPTSTTVTTTGSGEIDRVELTVADSTGILRGQDVTGTGIAAGTVVVQISGDEVILSLPLTATITNSSVTFSNLVATTVNGGATAAFNGFNGPATFNVFYDFVADNFVVDTLSVGSFPSTTAANIANIANIFNTQSKYVGRGVYDTTNNRLMIASGPNANSPWYIADGSASVTPA